MRNHCQPPNTQLRMMRFCRWGRWSGISNSGTPHKGFRMESKIAQNTDSLWPTNFISTLSSSLESSCFLQMSVSLYRTREQGFLYGHTVSIPLCLERSTHPSMVLRMPGLTSVDVQFCSPTFWSMLQDPICSLDIAMSTIVFIHVNLTIGTLSRHLKGRPDFKPLVESLLRFDTVGLYLMTERGHGIDAYNIETTATKTADGYVLHTPREEAAK